MCGPGQLSTIETTTSFGNARGTSTRTRTIVLMAFFRRLRSCLVCGPVWSAVIGKQLRSVSLMFWARKLAAGCLAGRVFLGADTGTRPFFCRSSQFTQHFLFHVSHLRWQYSIIVSSVTHRADSCPDGLHFPLPRQQKTYGQRRCNS